MPVRRRPALPVCIFAAGVSVQQEGRSRLQQRALEAALAGGRCALYWSLALAAGPAASAARAAYAFGLSRHGGSADVRIIRESGLQRKLQRTSLHRDLLWAEEQDNLLTSASDEALLALAALGSAPASYTRRLWRARPTSTPRMQPASSRQSAGEPQEQSYALWGLRLACAGTPSWFSPTHTALWVVGTGHQRGPGPPATLRRRPEARIRLDSSRSSSSCEMALCR